MLVVLRHGRTVWNEEGRIQGRADVPLSESGRRALMDWDIPADWRTAPCCVSPLRRARETAEVLRLLEPVITPALIEMDWGSFEGRKLADLRLELGDALAVNEARGLDFSPPGGESPRDLAGRLQHWIVGLDCDDEDVVLVTHKGVRRALLALATGWDMEGPPPVKLRDDEALRLSRDASGRLAVVDTVSLARPRER
jgi:probable phosphoglycerate mutase